MRSFSLLFILFVIAASYAGTDQAVKKPLPKYGYSVAKIINLKGRIFAVVTKNGEKQSVLTDMTTGLIWNAGSPDSIADGVDCKSLKYGGFNDWRVPGVNDLAATILSDTECSGKSYAFERIFNGSDSFLISHTDYCEDQSETMPIRINIKNGCVRGEVKTADKKAAAITAKKNSDNKLCAAGISPFSGDAELQNSIALYSAQTNLLESFSAFFNQIEMQRMYGSLKEYLDAVRKASGQKKNKGRMPVYFAPDKDINSKECLNETGSCRGLFFSNKKEINDFERRVEAEVEAKYNFNGNNFNCFFREFEQISEDNGTVKTGFSKSGKCSGEPLKSIIKEMYIETEFEDANHNKYINICIDNPGEKIKLLR